MFSLRLATLDDVPRLRALIDASVRGLGVGYYTPAQIESALKYVFGPDTLLIEDGTYFVIENEAGELIAAGGWSRRRKVYGGDQLTAAEDTPLDPACDPARIRARSTSTPTGAAADWPGALFERCAADTAAAGFRELELVATLPGEPLYLALGFTPGERSEPKLPDGEVLPVVRMTRLLA